MGIGSLIYAFFYTLFLYRNPSGITYPFFAGGSCLLFFYYLKKSAPTAGNMLHWDWPGRKYSLFITACLLLLGFSVCYTDSLPLQILAKLLFFFLFMYLMLSNTYQDKDWDFFTYLGRMIALPFTAIGFLFQPFAALGQFISQRRQKQEKNKYFVPVLWGLIIAIPVLCVILLLLGSADMVFGNLLGKLFTFSFPVQVFNNLFWLLFSFLFAFFASYCMLYSLSRQVLQGQETSAARNTKEPVTGITITLLLSLVYVVFCVIQIFYLFCGIGTLPEGYTYAEYAREGYFQLLFVCLFNILLVLLCNRLFKKHRLLQGLLSFICACTCLMIASSAYRMLLYISAYGLTFLRVFVLWTLSVMVLVLIGTLILICRSQFPFVKYTLAVIVVPFLLLVFARPDAGIARYNLATDRDSWYLHQLSADAAPVILKVDPHFLDEYDTPQKDTVRSFNFSRWAAYRAYRNSRQ